MAKHDDDYKVGYGRPPIHSRFKKGKSGNPDGRKKGSKNFATVVKSVLFKPMSVKGRQNRKIPLIEGLLNQLAQRAFDGDHKAVDQLLDLARMLPPERNDGAPVGSDAADLATLRDFLDRHRRTNGGGEGNDGGGGDGRA